MPYITNLRCEGLAEPLGIGMPSPRLSWNISSEIRSARSVAWRLQVWEDSGEHVWDSGIVDGYASEVVYSGIPLKNRGCYNWRVKVWMSDGSETEWSDKANFECGFFDIEAWPGYWILYSSNILNKENLTVNHLRGEFSLRQDKPLRRARALVAATASLGILGNDALRMNLYELRLNGHKVGDDLINPGQLSQRRGRALFRVYDIAPYLNERNAVGLIYAAGKVSVQLFLDYEDGGSERIGCGPDWRWNSGGGPFTRLWKHDIKEYGGRGEVYDARAEFSGWDTPGFDESSWLKAFPCSSPELLAPQTFSVQVHETIHPKSIAKLDNGVAVVDFGRNFNGFAKVKLKGATGDRISLRFAETLKPSGEIDCGSVSCHPDFDQLDIYIKKSDEPEDYSPTFATHGFRYMSVEGQRENPELSDVKGLSICAALPNRSSFHTSDSRLNRLHKLCVDTLRSNIVSIPTDCPGRERNGWTADAYLVTDAEFLIFDAIHIYRKWFDDVTDMQESDGHVPYICPFPFPPYGKDVVWAACFTLSVWEAYRNSGDKAMLRHLYIPLTKLGKFLANFATSGERISDFIFFAGDHLAKERPTSEFMGYAYCYRNLDILARICQELGECSAAVYFMDKASVFKSLLNRRFVNSDGLYDNSTQSANAHALHFGFADEKMRPDLLDHLVSEIKRKPEFKSGMLGYYSLMEALSKNGRDDAVWSLVASDEPGAWGYWMKKFDATSAAEVWIPDPEKMADSWNHPMLIGGLTSWLYRSLGGIRPLTPGYGRFAVKPFFASGINDLSVTIDTPHGLVKSEWRRFDSGMELSVCVPVNATADIHIPCSEPGTVFEGGVKAMDSNGVSILRSEPGHSVLGVGAGCYSFKFNQL